MHRVCRMLISESLMIFEQRGGAVPRTCEDHVFGFEMCENLDFMASILRRIPHRQAYSPLALYGSFAESPKTSDMFTS